MFKSIDEKEKRKEIDLSGPDGNVFSLIAVAMGLCKTLGLDADEIRADMMSKDYNHAIDVLEEHFTDYIILYK